MQQDSWERLSVGRKGTLLQPLLIYETKLEEQNRVPGIVLKGTTQAHGRGAGKEMPSPSDLWPKELRGKVGNPGKFSSLFLHHQLGQGESLGWLAKNPAASGFLSLLPLFSFPPSL